DLLRAVDHPGIPGDLQVLADRLDLPGANKDRRVLELRFADRAYASALDRDRRVVRCGTGEQHGQNRRPKLSHLPAFSPNTHRPSIITRSTRVVTSCGSPERTTRFASFPF